VIRLPPYYPDLKPIEKIWGIGKTRIGAKKLLLSCEMFSNWKSRILPL
jgi:transposase